ncbi:hypothetical protein SEA_LYMARA_75 [Arthrobacter phage Lymara]|uniref:Uncharacterized protein n=1 Tax=Arthrobacter phage Lymara TaxID=2599828 RepID=A0A5J6TVN1_9CAUD|nr:hypothetical protein HYQ01_gp075 [Arthrobacter phage Lymara]QFG14876.1 hypothetical protein SEA_LYMARA_75 [Arthrobacter phage Lymara]
MTHPLVEFLAVRFAEEQADATNALKIKNGEPIPKDADHDYSMDVFGWESFADEHQTKVVNTWNPVRVLAEVHAKRGILAMHTAEDGGHGWHGWERTNGLVCTTCGDVDDRPNPWPCDTLKWLGQPYQDHEDYQGAWAHDPVLG